MSVSWLWPWQPRASAALLGSDEHDRLRKRLQGHLQQAEERRREADVEAAVRLARQVAHASASASKEAQFGAALDRDALKWRRAQQRPKASASAPSSLFSSQMLTDTWSTVTDSVVTKLPAYASYVVEATAKVLPPIIPGIKQDPPAASETSAESAAESASARAAKEEPAWKQHAARSVSKATVDARTTFCVESLKEAAQVRGGVARLGCNNSWEKILPRQD